MDVPSEAPVKANGLKTLLDVIIAPKEAFEQLRIAPTWGWAFLVALVLYTVGTFLLTPALVHATQAGFPEMVAATPQLQQLTPEQQQAQLKIVLTVISFSWVFAIFIFPLILLVQTVVLLIFKAIGRGDAGFGKLWAVACNVAVPSIGLGSICVAIVAMIRGADSFQRATDVQTAMPSLALIAPAAGAKLHVFLGLINPFSLWGCFLMATGLIVTARVSKTVGWIGAVAILVVGAALAAAGAK
ncbi:MAG: YIP1 family protein [Candidatus Eremiobacteraeota bacterium]|nr:YIP1 family protein [Candidatus Eremiobacteraeota bacterium]